MRALVFGASGATGKLVVRQLIKRQVNVRIVIRAGAVLSKEVQENPQVEIIRGNINEFTDSEMNNILEDCNAIVSCLGHNITLKGMFGKPRNLVFDAIRGVNETVRKKADKKVKLILMSTTAFTNTKTGEETNSIGEKIVFFLLNVLLPPHRDNVKAASYLIKEIGKDNEKIEWVAVRPDTLENNDNETSYEIYESRVRSPILNAGVTSRINVSHFMAELLTNENLWKEWKFKTPVIYNK